MTSALLVPSLNHNSQHNQSTYKILKQNNPTQQEMNIKLSRNRQVQTGKQEKNNLKIKMSIREVEVVGKSV